MSGEEAVRIALLTVAGTGVSVLNSWNRTATFTPAPIVAQYFDSRP
jgi:hypothetical protein